MRFLFLVFITACYLIIPSSSVYAESSRDNYKLNNGDVISVTVIDHPEMSTVVVITPDGTINLPYVGNVSVVGKEISAVEREITSKLKTGYLEYPVVSVRLTSTATRTIFTYGEISKRGTINFEKDMTLMGALSVAGGISPDGLYGKLKIKRKQKIGGYKAILETTLKRGFIGDETLENMPLQPDDMLIIERSETFFIHGEVIRPGQYVLENNMTVIKSLSLAGGINQGGLFGKLKIRRKHEGTIGGYKEILEADIKNGIIVNKEIEDAFLQPDDILIVERSNTFFIHGEVVKLGQYVLEENMTVIKALSMAGGISPNGLYGKIKLRRKQEGVLGYKEVLEANIANGIIEDKEKEDTLLQPDDILIVERDKTYFVYGEIQRLGEYVIRADMTVLKAITIAGGFTKWGAPDRVKLLRLKEDNSGYVTIKVNISKVMEGDVSADIILRSGDIIVASPGIF